MLTSTNRSTSFIASWVGRRIVHVSAERERCLATKIYNNDCTQTNIANSKGKLSSKPRTCFDFAWYKDQQQRTTKSYTAQSDWHHVTL